MKISVIGGILTSRALAAVVCGSDVLELVNHKLHELH